MIKWLCLLLMMGLQGCTHMLFYPMQQHVLSPDRLDIAYDDIYVDSSNATRLHGWWLHSREDLRGTVLFFHGNAQNISTHLAHVYWLVDYGYDVVMIDYRGYGKSSGKPEMDGIIQDIQATLGYVLDSEINSERPLFVLGQSIGGSLSVAALAKSEYKDKLSGILLIGSFSDYHKVTRHALSGFWLTWPLQWPLSFTVDNRYSPEQYIASLSPVPVLIMHGEQDEVVPVEHARTLFEQARQPKFIEQVSGDHNHILENQANRNVVLQYLERFSVRS